jgi:hypothetical protein
LSTSWCSAVSCGGRWIEGLAPRGFGRPNRGDVRCAESRPLLSVKRVAPSSAHCLTVLTREGDVLRSSHPLSGIDAIGWCQSTADA